MEFFFWSRGGASETISGRKVEDKTVQGLGFGAGLSPLQKSKKKVRQLPKGEMNSLRDSSHASEALAMLTQQTQHAFMGLESTLGSQGLQGEEDMEKDIIFEDLVKKFEEMASSQV